MSKLSAVEVKKIQRRHAEIQQLGTAERGYTDSGLWKFLNYVMTKDEHDDDAAMRPLIGPGDEYIIVAFLYMLACKKLLIPKSRQIRMSWLTVTYCLWRAMSRPNRLVVFQTKKDEDAESMTSAGSKYPGKGRADFIVQCLPRWLADPHIKSGSGSRAGELIFSPYQTDPATGVPVPWWGSIIRGIPGGANQVASNTGSLIVYDECIYHDDFEEAVAVALPAVNGGGQFIGVSSVYRGTDFNAMVLNKRGGVDGVNEVPAAVKRGMELFGIEGLPKGMRSWMTDDGVQVLEIHYTADPKKDPARDGAAWFAEAPKGYRGGTNSQKWKREMEIDYEAGGGEPVFEFATSGSPIYIDGFSPMSIIDKMRFYAGYDYGARNPSAFEVWGIDKEGRAYAVWELYEPCLNIGEHVAKIKRCPYWDRIEYVMCDPSITAKNQQSASGVRSLSEQFADYGFYVSPSRRAADIPGAHLFLSKYWADPENPKAFITKACPSLWQEVMGLRWKEHTSALVASRRNNPEEILDKNNHATDATFYLFDADPMHFVPAAAIAPTNTFKAEMDRALGRMASEEARRGGIVAY